MKITNIKARQIIDSRGNTTVESEVEIDGKYVGRSSVPSGASTGSHEALELRDGNLKIYNGQSVLNAVGNVNTRIKNALTGLDNKSQGDIDNLMIQLDGSENKSNLGANAILSVSLAYAWAVSKSKDLQLFEYIGELFGNNNFILPRPMFNIMNGGKHANWATDIQEFVAIPLKVNTWAENLRRGCEIFHSLEGIIKAKGLSVNVGNEGGFAPDLESNEEAVKLIIQAVEKAGYKLGEDVSLGFDAAASEFYNSTSGNYELRKDKKTYTSKEMVDWVISLTKKYPLVSLEDMLSQDDWSSWTDLTSKVNDNIQVVGDDLLVTNVERINKAINEKACNALLVKVNQIGTLTETLNAIKTSSSAGWKNIISHRSGETEDVTIAHLAVGTSAGQIKSGAPSRSERTAKYNELLRIEEYLLKI